MAVKKKYAIPTSLDTSFLDLSFTFKTKDGLRTKKPIPARTILLFLGSVFLLIYLWNSTFVGKGGTGKAIIFSILWLALTLVLSLSDKTKRAGFELIPAMINYLPKPNRRMYFRAMDDVGRLKLLMGIRDVDIEDGLIHFLDGTVGYAYDVVGSASILMFDGDKHEIVDKVDSFYRKLAPTCEIIYDTVKESQRTDRQIASNKIRHSRCMSNSPGLQTLFQETNDVLELGVSDRYKSIHQYMVLKAKGRESLEEGKALVLGDVENSQLMFKYVREMTYDDVLNYVKNIYGAPSKH